MTDPAEAALLPRSLRGRRAIVSGGTTGIGRAIAVMLAAHGARVFVGGRDPQHLADALESIAGAARDGGGGDGVTMDLSDPDNVARFFAAGAASLGGYDIAVVNAAVGAGGLMQTTEAELRHVVALDFTAYLLSAHAAAHAMETLGDIVLMGSMSAHVLGPSSTVYAGIKAGIAGFAEALRRELGPRGIRVALVEPGKTGSDMQKPAVSDDEMRRRIHDQTMLAAEDIAAGVRYLLTQPDRVVVQQLTIVPRCQDGE